MSTYTITTSLTPTLVEVTLPCGKVSTCICDSVDSGITVGWNKTPIAETGWPVEVVASIEDYFTVVHVKRWTVEVSS